MDNDLLFINKAYRFYIGKYLTPCYTHTGDLLKAKAVNLAYSYIGPRYSTQVFFKVW